MDMPATLCYVINFSPVIESSFEEKLDTVAEGYSVQ